MSFSPHLILWLAFGISLGITFSHLVKSKKHFPLKKTNTLRVNHKTRNIKLYATFATLIAVAITSWFIKYLGATEGWRPIFEEIFSAIFGVSTAGLLGGIVFELFLREEILTETSEVLAEIVTTEKSIVQEIFTTEKRNKIIELMMQLNTGNDTYGSALYHDFIARYTDEALGYKKEFRYNFEDSITFFDIDPKTHPEFIDFFEVIDNIRFQTHLSEYLDQEYFVFGCAENEENLYKFFTDPNCLYRWLFKTTNKEMLSKTFHVKLSVDCAVCHPIDSIMTNRGYEIRFANPFYNKEFSDFSKNEKIIEFEFEIRTLHPKVEGFIAVHLAYPVKGAEINFDFENAKGINNVSRLHFLTAGKITPRIEDGVSSSFEKDKAQRKYKVKISNDHWLFPDSGIIFVWEKLEE